MEKNEGNRTFVRITNQQIWDKLNEHDKRFDKIEQLLEGQKTFASDTRKGLYALGAIIGTALVFIASALITHLAGN